MFLVGGWLDMLTSRIEIMKKLFLILLPVIFFGCKPSVNDEGASQVQVREVQVPDGNIEEEEKGVEIMNENNPIARINTNMGEIVIELYEDAAPNTVANFVSLAEGGFYKDVIFHRVIKGFMAQGGDPTGTGTGGPGYRFADEINAIALGLDKEKEIGQSQMQAAQREVFQKYGVDSQEKLNELVAEIGEEKLMKEIMDAANALATGASKMDGLMSDGYSFDDSLPSVPVAYGTIAMANAGPNTNGSQFFINHKDNFFLNGKHTAFGMVIEGMDVIDRICNLPTDGRDRPVEDVRMQEVIIENKRDHDYTVVKIED
ncbi:peptidylprolyl isomerase [bacterium]|nr:peptidylprolyl isomerase [bacterium]